MSRLKTIFWLLLIIVLIGFVAVATRTPAVSGGVDRASASEATSEPADPSAQSPSQ